MEANHVVRPHLVADLGPLLVADHLVHRILGENNRRALPLEILPERETDLPADFELRHASPARADADFARVPRIHDDRRPGQGAGGDDRGRGVNGKK